MSPYCHQPTNKDITLIKSAAVKTNLNIYGLALREKKTCVVLQWVLLHSAQKKITKDVKMIFGLNKNERFIFNVLIMWLILRIGEFVVFKFSNYAKDLLVGCRVEFATLFPCLHFLVSFVTIERISVRFTWWGKGFKAIWDVFLDCVWCACVCVLSLRN